MDNPYISALKCAIETVVYLKLYIAFSSMKCHTYCYTPIVWNEFLKRSFLQVHRWGVNRRCMRENGNNVALLKAVKGIIYYTMHSVGRSVGSWYWYNSLLRNHVTSFGPVCIYGSAFHASGNGWVSYFGRRYFLLSRYKPYFTTLHITTWTLCFLYTPTVAQALVWCLPDVEIQNYHPFLQQTVEFHQILSHLSQSRDSREENRTLPSVPWLSNFVL